VTEAAPIFNLHFSAIERLSFAAETGIHGHNLRARPDVLTEWS
jgi:hypothetical protein